MPKLRRIAGLLVALFFLSLPHVAAYAQEENVSTNITLINVTVTVPAGFYVSAYLENGTVVVYVSAGVVTGNEPPPVNITVGKGSTLVALLRVSPSNYTCYGMVCRWTGRVPVNASAAWVLVEAPGYKYNLTVSEPAGGFDVVDLASVLAFVIPATLAARTNVRKAGVGMIVGGVVVYVLGNYAGLVSAKPVFYVVPIVVGALLLFLAD